MEKKYALQLLFPGFILTSFILYLLSNTFWFSLLDEGAFIGFKGYLSIDPIFPQAVIQTFYLIATAVPLEFLIGLLMALILYNRFRGRSFFLVVFLLPWAIAPFLQAQIWKWMLISDYGVLNQILVSTGLCSTPPNLLINPSLTTGAMLGVIMAEVWKCSTFVMIILLAGLVAIPSSLMDAAKIDANRWFGFKHVTIPLLFPSILVALLWRTLDTLRMFDLPWILTGGGPGIATEVMSTATYRFYFKYMDIGGGSVLAMMTLIICAVFAFIYTRLMIKRMRV